MYIMVKWGQFGFAEQIHASLIVILLIAYATMIHKVRVSKPKDFFDNAPSCTKDKSCDTWINQSTFEYDLGPDPSLEIATSFVGFLLGVFLSSFVDSYVLKALSKNIYGLSFLFISCASLIWGMYYAGLFQQGNGNSSYGKYAYLMYPMLGAFIIICEKTVTKIFDRIGHRGDFEHRTEIKLSRIMDQLDLTNETNPDSNSESKPVSNSGSESSESSASSASASSSSDEPRRGIGLTLRNAWAKTKAWSPLK